MPLPRKKKKKERKRENKKKPFNVCNDLDFARMTEQMILESVQTLVEHSVGGQPQQQHRHTQEGTRRMSLVDLGKRLLEAAKRGETDAVRALMSNGAPFTTDWVRHVEQ